MFPFRQERRFKEWPLLLDEFEERKLSGFVVTVCISSTLSSISGFVEYVSLGLKKISKLEFISLD